MNHVTRMLQKRGIDAVITPNFAPSANGASNGPKQLDIAVPSSEDMNMAYAYLARMDRPIRLSTGERAVIKAVGATPLQPGRPADINLHVKRENGRFRRLDIRLHNVGPAAPVRQVNVAPNAAMGGNAAPSPRSILKTHPANPEFPQRAHIAFAPQTQVRVFDNS